MTDQQSRFKERGRIGRAAQPGLCVVKGCDNARHGADAYCWDHQPGGDAERALKEKHGMGLEARFEELPTGARRCRYCDGVTLTAPRHSCPDESGKLVVRWDQQEGLLECGHNATMYGHVTSGKCVHLACMQDDEQASFDYRICDGQCVPDECVCPSVAQRLAEIDKAVAAERARIVGILETLPIYIRTEALNALTEGEQ